MAFTLVAPSAIATAMDTSAAPRPISGNFPRSRQRRSRRAGQPGLAGQLAQQHRTGMPGQALARAGHRQLVVPPGIVQDEERSCRRNHVSAVTA